MDWKLWIGKKVFIRLKNNRVYSGIVTDIDDSVKSMIFISMNDKFSLPVSFIHTEILEIREEQ